MGCGVATRLPLAADSFRLVAFTRVELLCISEPSGVWATTAGLGVVLTGISTTPFGLVRGYACLWPLLSALFFLWPSPSEVAVVGLSSFSVAATG